MHTGPAVGSRDEHWLRRILCDRLLGPFDRRVSFRADVRRLVQRRDFSRPCAPPSRGPPGAGDRWRFGAAIPAFRARARSACRLRIFINVEAPGQPDLTWHLDESPHVAEAIVARATAMRAQLIALATHGCSNLRRCLLGAVTERVLRTAPCAVLAVPPLAQRPPSKTVRLRRIVCATDFSLASARALRYAVPLAVAAEAALTVAHIVELPPQVPEMVVDLTPYRHARFNQAQKELDAAVTPYAPTLAVDKLLLAGGAGPELLRLAAEQQADLLVMGLHGRGAGDLMLFGSITQHVLRRASCAVLAVPAGN